MNQLSPTTARQSAFGSFDDHLLARTPGLIVVTAPRELHVPLLSHVERRLRSAFASAIVVDAPPNATRTAKPLFREIGAQLGLRSFPTDPRACAAAIAEGVRKCGGAIVGYMPRAGTWDYDVANELASARAVVAVLVGDGAAPATWGAASFDVDDSFDDDARARWFGAVVQGLVADRSEPPTLATLDRRWRSASPTLVGAEQAPRIEALSPVQREIIVLLSLAGCSVPAEFLATASLSAGNATPNDLAELERGRFVVVRGPVVALSSEIDVSSEPVAIDRFARAAGLIAASSTRDTCPWLEARAAELFVEAGDLDLAEEHIERALRAANDHRLVAELTTRWHQALAPLAAERGIEVRLRAAERSLALGDAREAMRWCDELSAVAPARVDVAVLRGRTLFELGDLVAARVALARAAQAVASAGGDLDLTARVDLSRAEVEYAAGQHDRARELATQAATTSRTPSVQLEGRNIIGKTLLAAGRWHDADVHFAADALYARESGARPAELRARLNRAIAILSRGHVANARSLLESVLEESVTVGDETARSYALRNLAVVAYRQHDYMRALGHWEAALVKAPAPRGLTACAYTVANLADLRLRLGLVEHAEHTLAFGRRQLGGRGTALARANIAVVSARVALARNELGIARREVEAAVACAEDAGDCGDRLPEACLTAARVALAEGDLARVAVLVERAESMAVTPPLRAEVALMRALELRARGEAALAAAIDAITAARSADDEMLVAEAHALTAAIHRCEGDDAAAIAHERAALSVHAGIAADLSPEIRAAYLAKREVIALKREATTTIGGAEHGPSPASSKPPPSSAAPEIVGDTPRIRGLVAAVRKVARSNCTVLVRGESGTGKELVAGLLHRESARAKGPLVSVNCAALVETLLLSELFGHEKGAFTGASSRKRGRFELAERGTLFLDEIGDITPATQVALLRVLQERTFERVGGTVAMTADVRIVCATHRDLEAMVRRGEFREDLYYRLQGVTIEVPPLRDRIQDLPNIADVLLARFAAERSDPPRSLAPDALSLLMRHRWPGNVRELENVLRACSVLADGPRIELGDLVEHVDTLRALAQSPSASLPNHATHTSSEEAAPESPLSVDAVYAELRGASLSLPDLKRRIVGECIARALAETNGNITRAAAILGVKRPRLSQLVKDYGLTDAYRPSTARREEEDYE